MNYFILEKYALEIKSLSFWTFHGLTLTTRVENIFAVWKPILNFLTKVYPHFLSIS